MKTFEGFMKALRSVVLVSGTAALDLYFVSTLPLYKWAPRFSSGAIHSFLLELLIPVLFLAVLLFQALCLIGFFIPKKLGSAPQPQVTSTDSRLARITDMATTGLLWMGVLCLDLMTIASLDLFLTVVAFCHFFFMYYAIGAQFLWLVNQGLDSSSPLNRQRQGGFRVRT